MENESQKQVWDEWHDWIQRAKEIYEEPPIPAQLNPNGTITPGYNGIRINIGASKKKMGDSRDVSQLVFEELEPSIFISDFSPAPIFFGNPNKPAVSFMVNVAWGNEYLEEILQVMAKYNVKSSFFLDGSWVNKFPLIAKKIILEGHEIGSHAYSHPDMRGITEEQIVWELVSTNQVIQQELGIKPNLFTPPSGEYDDRVVRIAAQEGMYTILSTLDTLDWQDPPYTEIVNKVKKKVRNGSIILMHPTRSSLKALPIMIQYIQSKNYKVDTIRELLSAKRTNS